MKKIIIILIISGFIIPADFRNYIKPFSIKKIVVAECRKYKSPLITWENIASIISVESSFYADAISKDNCRGLGGISEVLILEYSRVGKKGKIKHFRPGVTKENIFIIDLNIALSVWYFDQCLKMAGQDLERAFTLYFWGINSDKNSTEYSRKVLKRKEGLIKNKLI